MCFGYVLGTFFCFVYKWMKLGFDLVNDYEEEDLQKPIYTQQHYELAKESLFDKIKKAVDSEKLFIINDYGERIKIELSHTDGDNVVFNPDFNIDKTSYFFDRCMNNYKEYVVCDGKNTPVEDYLKSDFNKQALEADKELQRVCSDIKTQIREVYQEWIEDENEKTGWSGLGWQFKDDDEFMEERKWTIIEHLDSDKYYNPILAIAQRD
jgi:hypothetical protein